MSLIAELTMDQYKELIDHAAWALFWCFLLAWTVAGVVSSLMGETE